MVQVKVIDKDPSLPHQIIIGAGRHAGEISVSCNCWRHSSSGYKPIDHVTCGEGTVQKALDIYNLPSNHNQHVCEQYPFHPDIEWGDRHVVEVQ